MHVTRIIFHCSTGSGEEDVEEDQQSFPMQNIPPESSVGAQQQQQHEQQQQQLHNQEQQRLLEQQNEDSPSAADDDVDVNDMPEDDGSRISPVQDNAFNRDNESGSESRADEDERGEDEREEDDRDGPNNVDDASGGEQAARDASNEVLKFVHFNDSRIISVILICMMSIFTYFSSCFYGIRKNRLRDAIDTILSS